MEEKYYIGTDLKFALDISVEGGGFDQASGNYDIDIYCGSKHLHFDQSDIVQDGDDFFLCIPTKELRAGIMKMVVTAYVEDDDFPEGVRREVAVENIATLKSVL